MSRNAPLLRSQSTPTPPLTRGKRPAPAASLSRPRRSNSTAAPEPNTASKRGSASPEVRSPPLTVDSRPDAAAKKPVSFQRLRRSVYLPPMTRPKPLKKDEIIVCSCPSPPSASSSPSDGGSDEFIMPKGTERTLAKQAAAEEARAAAAAAAAAAAEAARKKARGDGRLQARGGNGNGNDEDHEDDDDNDDDSDNGGDDNAPPARFTGCYNSSCDSRAALIECDPRACLHGDACGNQRIGRAQWAKVAVKKTPGRGFGLFLKEDVPEGALIVEYCGEVINGEEASHFLSFSIAYSLIALSHTHLCSIASFPNRRHAVWPTIPRRELPTSTFTVSVPTFSSMPSTADPLGASSTTRATQTASQRRGACVGRAVWGFSRGWR